MLNPSVADGLSDDPTIRRCIGYAQTLGSTGSASSSSSPSALRTQEDSVRMQTPLPPGVTSSSPEHASFTRQFHGRRLGSRQLRHRASQSGRRDGYLPQHHLQVLGQDEGGPPGSPAVPTPGRSPRRMDPVTGPAPFIGTLGLPAPHRAIHQGPQATARHIKVIRPTGHLRVTSSGQRSTLVLTADQ